MEVLPMETNQTPAPIVDARNRIVAAYAARRREFDLIVASCDYDYDIAWTIFAGRVCPELPHSYVLDAADYARLSIKYEERARHRIVTHYERVGA
jgi:hypothetical protein